MAVFKCICHLFSVNPYRQSSRVAWDEARGMKWYDLSISILSENTCSVVQAEYNWVRTGWEMPNAFWEEGFRKEQVSRLVWKAVKENKKELSLSCRASAVLLGVLTGVGGKAVSSSSVFILHFRYQLSPNPSGSCSAPTASEQCLSTKYFARSLLCRNLCIIPFWEESKNKNSPNHICNLQRNSIWQRPAQGYTLGVWGGKARKIYQSVHSRSDKIKVSWKESMCRIPKWHRRAINYCMLCYL